MPTRAVRRAAQAPALGAAAAVPPLSVTRPELLEDGSDRAFRKVIWGMLVVAQRLQKYPEAFGKHLGLSSAMYMVLIATAHCQGAAGIGIRALAEHMHLPPPHVTTTVGKLVRKGLLVKRPNPEDGRAVLVSLTAAGHDSLRRLSPFQSSVNDALFDRLTKGEFKTFARFIDLFVENTENALTVARKGRRRPPAA